MKMLLPAIIPIVLLIVLIIVLLKIYCRDIAECNARGGALVMGQCIRLEVIP